MVSKAAGGKPCAPLDKPKTRTEKGRIVDKGRGPRINKDLRRILKRLDQCHIDDNQIRKELTQCASEFGLIGNELHDAVGRLISFTLTKAASADSTFSREEVLEQVANFPGPRRLLDPEVFNLMKDELVAFRNRAGLPVDAIPRSGVELNRDALSHALVVLVGDGGTGKTATLAEFVGEVVESHRAVGRFSAVKGAAFVDASWPGQVVANWRNLAGWASNAEGLETALLRLEAAGTKAQPMLILGLDAIDEVCEPSAHRREVQRFIDFFLKEERSCRADGRPPRATLIVTCRSEEEWKHIAAIDRGGFGVQENLGEMISIGDFVDEELIALAETLKCEQVANRIRKHAAGGTSLPVTTLGFDLPIQIVSAFTVQTVRTVNAVTGQAMDADFNVNAVESLAYAAIKHPAVWRCFTDLDETGQHLVLDGDFRGLEKLASSLVEWFCNKTRLRKNLGCDATRAVLEAVAACFDDWFRMGEKTKDWIEPAVAVTNCAVVQANLWFSEAVSSGLIVKEATTTWRWRHPFVCEYLRAASNGT
jgi:hypothetical protein